MPIFKKKHTNNEPIFNIDSPISSKVSDNNLLVSGWILPPEGKEIERVEIINGDKRLQAKYGHDRPDVADAFPSLSRNISLYSGFSLNINLSSRSLLRVRAYFKDGSYTDIYNKKLTIINTETYDSIYFDALGSNTAKNKVLMECKSKYFYENEIKAEYVRHPDDPKLIAFYLPQFHPIKENDEAWGKGFTEWTNVVSGQPRFIEHQQPVLPSDLGFYDLRIQENIENQINIAKRHGIYGFCFYYYWFSGKKLLEKPLDILFKNKELNFNFMICWANENWTKRWDGKDKEIIISQQYNEDDPIKFIKDVEDIILDKRYVRINDRPVVCVYRVSDLKDPLVFTETWRRYFKDKHNIDLYLLSVLGFDSNNPKDFGFDDGIDFVPLSVKRKYEKRKEPLPKINLSGTLLDKKFEGVSLDYRKISKETQLDNEYRKASFKSVMPAWDNDARKKGSGSEVYSRSNPDLYYEWLDRIINNTYKIKTPDNIVFINAWNEWAEGAVLEPSKFYGYSYLNRTTEALSKYSKKQTNLKNFPSFQIKNKKKSKLAVIVHINNNKEWLNIAKYLKNINFIKYDLYITTTTNTQSLQEVIDNKHPEPFIVEVPYVGNDILPFLFIAGRLKQFNYKSILKLSLDGDSTYNVEEILSSQQAINKSIKMLDSKASMIGPLSDKEYSTSQESELPGYKYHDKSKDYAFFKNGIFWIRFNTLLPLLEKNFSIEDFYGKDETYFKKILGILCQGKTYSQSFEDIRKV